MKIRFDTRDKKPKLKALPALTAAAAVLIGFLVWIDAKRFAAEACFVMAAYALGMILALLWAFREQIHYNPYSYNTIFYFGFALFALSVMITHFALGFRVAKQPEFYS